MTTRFVSAVAGGGLALLLMASLSACATDSSDPTPPASGGTGGATEVEVDAAWLDGGRMVGLVTQGSSSCVPIADGATLSADGVLEVTLVEPASEVCTADMAPRVTVVSLPAGIDPSQDLQIEVAGDGYRGETDLDGVAGLPAPSGETDYAPSAGWVDDGVFAIVTWGSSSCPPTVQDIEVTASDAVTVTFAEPEPDRMCTMDIAPRAVLAYPEGDLDADAPVTLTLTGGGPEFAMPVTTTILG
ncbi:hypothetical protein QNO21_00940 [Microbacterium sp. zg-Y818]|uniref:hypothetical protein n=1 Tax=unclassified Microbacterium TaxID=2609290 RepID=UPI00214C85DD|nr:MULTISPECIES: hypothetical protein [unclassified Microbacterium]MCR2802086.1 hypothetical protein [Microbacterium sp. zg.Y818]WIM22633.1 hypothetical protein QNO21_00940 [Microbacterium sp. zg-Y818]